MSYLYPVTIVQTRYSGVYEGALWVAFNEYPESLDESASGAFADDVTCGNWWDDTRNTDKVGRGDTPQEAYDDLKMKVKG